MAFERDALLLIGHGSSRYSDAARLLHDHARALRAGGQLAETAVGLLRGSPGIAQGLAGLTAAVVHIVPFFMEDGYFTRVAVPDALGRHCLRGGQTLHYCPPVGTHDGMADLIGARVLRHCADPGGWTVVLVGHGSARAPGRSLALHRHQARLSGTGVFGRVRSAHLEEPPLVADVLADLRAVPAAVVGYFAGQGGHVREDLPRLIAAERAARAGNGPPLWDLGSVARDPAMERIIMDQVALGDWLGSAPTGPA